MSVFPPNNLPDGAKYWVRDVEKRIINAETSFLNAEINNVSRDSQILSTANQALTAALDAKNAIDGLVGLGEATGSLYDINANNIKAGTIDASVITVSNLDASEITSGTIDASQINVTNISASNIDSGTLTGITVQTGTTGIRAVLQGSAINFYNGATKTGDIVGSDGVNDGVVINADSGYIALDAGNDITLSASVVTATGIVDAGGSIVTGGSLTRTALVGGGTTAAEINNAGNFQRASSSARYKADIRNLELPYESIVALQPKLFKRKDEFESYGDAARDYAGFVAEEVAGTDLDVFVAYEQMEDGTKRPDGIYYAELTAALVSALKHQDSVIKKLTERIEALESK